MTAAHWLGIAQASRAFAERSLSPVELLTSLLARIERLDPRLHAFIRLDADAAMDAARAAEKEIAAGHVRGPLHGVPIGVKDIIDVAGLPTTCHSKILLDNVAKHGRGRDSPKLRQAGAIIVGKLSTHEFAIGGPSFDLPFPPARNPWNPEHHPGGSSSGSGAGVCAGLFPLALGTDTGGSVRNPASACGIVGLKPTYGLVSRRGVFPLSFTLDHVGPLTRTVADTALMLDAIAGHDPADPGSAASPARHFGRMLDRGVRDLRIGFVRHFHETDMPAHPEVDRGAGGCGARAAGGRRRGAHDHAALADRIRRRQPRDPVQRGVVDPCAVAAHAPRRLWPVGPPAPAARRVHHRRRLCRCTAPALADDRRGRGRAARRGCAAVRQLDGSRQPDRGRRGDRAHLFAPGPHAVQRDRPSGAGDDVRPGRNGLPLSVQFVGRYFDEATLLRIAAAYEQATAWHKHKPPIG